jgi:hypothetical protein
MPGKLAVEIGFARMAEMQEEILWIGEAAHVPVIWATQVLEHLIKKGTPSRGEMTDAAMAARAECVMLNKIYSGRSTSSIRCSVGWGSTNTRRRRCYAGSRAGELHQSSWRCS